ncbi:MAG: FixH family protein [Dehalococcoidia bacterium]|nr:FixH family protein [Dehalococcoidia bacterium]
MIQNRDWVFVKNGGTVSLGNGLSLELFLSPYPPTKLRAVLDLYVTRDGKPVTDASGEITYDMKGMSHGPFVSVAANRGDGHYLFSLDYGMFSAWEHNLVLDLGKDRYELGAGMMVFPGPL